MSSIYVRFFVLSLVCLVSIPVSHALALQQTAADLDYDMELGETKTIQWGLISDEEEPVVLEMRAEGKGSELLSFPTKMDALPKQIVRINVTVTVPDDYQNNIELQPSIFALQRGSDEGQGGAIINIQMKKTLSIKIGEVAETPQTSKPQIEEAKPSAEEELEVDPEPTEEPGSTTIIAEPEEKPESQSQDNGGGGCLIATAAYGSELAEQVQMLREIRDTKILNTETGATFMIGFNEFYYSFSPTIADWERQNPAFKEMVRVVITPMLYTLSLMNIATDGSESDLVLLGTGVIILNLGIYVTTPTIIIIKIHSRYKSKTTSSVCKHQ